MTYRFFYHYYKQRQGMTVHFRGTCHPCKNVTCNVPCETKWNENRQPHVVMQGFCEEVVVENGRATIN